MLDYLKMGAHLRCHLLSNIRCPIHLAADLRLRKSADIFFSREYNRTGKTQMNGRANVGEAVMVLRGGCSCYIRDKLVIFGGHRTFRPSARHLGLCWLRFDIVVVVVFNLDPLRLLLLVSRRLAATFAVRDCLKVVLFIT